MGKIACHASLPKVDDIRLKGQPNSTRLCGLCDHAAVDDIKHLVLQCVRWQLERDTPFNEIDDIADGSGWRLHTLQSKFLKVLLGECIASFSNEQYARIWKISARRIASLYLARIRDGVG